MATDKGDGDQEKGFGSHNLGYTAKHHADKQAKAAQQGRHIPDLPRLEELMKTISEGRPVYNWEKECVIDILADYDKLMRRQPGQPVHDKDVQVIAAVKFLEKWGKENFFEFSKALVNLKMSHLLNLRDLNTLQEKMNDAELSKHVDGCPGCDAKKGLMDEFIEKSKAQEGDLIQSERTLASLGNATTDYSDDHEMVDAEVKNAISSHTGYIPPTSDFWKFVPDHVNFTSVQELEKYIHKTPTIHQMDMEMLADEEHKNAVHVDTIKGLEMEREKHLEQIKGQQSQIEQHNAQTGHLQSENKNLKAKLAAFQQNKDVDMQQRTHTQGTRRSRDQVGSLEADGRSADLTKKRRIKGPSESDDESSDLSTGTLSRGKFEQKGLKPKVHQLGSELHHAAKENVNWRWRSRKDCLPPPPQFKKKGKDLRHVVTGRGWKNRSRANKPITDEKLFEVVKTSDDAFLKIRSKSGEPEKTFLARIVAFTGQIPQDADVRFADLF